MGAGHASLITSNQPRTRCKSGLWKGQSEKVIRGLVHLAEETGLFEKIKIVRSVFEEKKSKTFEIFIMRFFSFFLRFFITVLK